MTSTQLPPLNFGGSGLRISIFAPLSVEDTEHVGSLDSQRDSRLVLNQAQEPTDPDRPTSDLPKPTPNIPVHPISVLQEAFSESLDEATNGSPGDKPKLRSLDARGRREALIAQDPEDEPFDARWRYRPGQSQHELLKLLAQISFGVYLLLNGMANSDAQVVNILQGHIDEVDEFLEVALEDLSQATKDLNGRIEHLKLPLANVQAFEQLLEDRNFRLEIIEGNEKIDHVITRTNVALKQWDGDIEAGLRCTAAFTSWLKDEEDATWRRDRPDVADIFDAMKGNAEGWLTAFDEMNDRVQNVTNVILRLSTIIREMEKKAGEVSRRTWANIQPYSSPSINSHHGSGSNAVSTKSASSSRQSARRPSHYQQPSIGASTTRSESIADIHPEENFPLPGGGSLLHPSRSQSHLDSEDEHKILKTGSMRHSKTTSGSTCESRQRSNKEAPAVNDDSLYVLQPHTYTPHPLDPGPSVARSATVSPDGQASAPATTQKNPLGISAQDPSQRRASIRNRVSLKTSPPEAIRIPPRAAADAAMRGASPNSATPHTDQSNLFDSAYGSDTDSTMQPVVYQVEMDSSISPPRRPQITHSPCSDHQQYYHPVRASPHSPLQQRPHTALDGRVSSNMHPRNQSSPLGGMSTTLNNVTYATRDDAQTRVSGSLATSGTVKKKKSAFGWFKKAFSLDEEEKAAFETRKAMQHQDRYYDPDCPKFLDGRRLR